MAYGTTSTPRDRRKSLTSGCSGDKSKARVVGRFAPKANPEYRFAKGEAELMTVVATDVLAEGLNLQDCDNIINYDLHWNPVRLIQRFGRIDRIGSEHEVIFAYNFLPEAGIDKNLGLKERLHNRIQEIHDTIGEDSQILDETERKHSFNLTHGQLHALRELRILFEATTEEEIKGNVNILEKAFRGALTGAVKRELNQLRRNAVTGEALYKNLIRIYDQHNLKDVIARRSLEFEDNSIPRIVCSEALV